MKSRLTVTKKKMRGEILTWSCFPDQNNLANNIPDNKKMLLKIFSVTLQITATDKKYAESKLNFKISNPISTLPIHFFKNILWEEV